MKTPSSLSLFVYQRDRLWLFLLHLQGRAGNGRACRCDQQCSIHCEGDIPWDGAKRRRFRSRELVETNEVVLPI